MAFYSYGSEHGSDSFETFYANQFDCEEWNESEGLSEERGDSIYTEGWYFAFGQAGCLYDSSPFGPYQSEENAYNAAIELITE